MKFSLRRGLAPGPPGADFLQERKDLPSVEKDQLGEHGENQLGTQQSMGPDGMLAGFFSFTVLAPLIFNIFINDLDDGTEGTFSKPADNTKRLLSDALPSFDLAVS